MVEKSSPTMVVVLSPPPWLLLLLRRDIFGIVELGIRDKRRQARCACMCVCVCMQDFIDAREREESREKETIESGKTHVATRP